MAGYKIVDAEKLDADLASVANAIRKKAGTNAKMEFPAGFESAVKNIPSGGAELPELGDTAAQPTDMVAGKVLYDDKGNPVTGTLYELDSIDESIFGTKDFVFGGTPGGTTFNVKGAYNVDIDGVIVRKGAGLGVRNAPTDFFGDARPENVTKGKKFTSAAGLLVEGTHEDEGGVELPELTNPASASDMALDKQLIDADGNVVTGTLAESGVDTNVMVAPEEIIEGTSDNTVFSYRGVYAKNYIGDADFKGFICRPGTNFVLRQIQTSMFGNATANQVAEGATFTSADGLLVPGSLPDGGGLTLYGGTPDIYVDMKPGRPNVKGITVNAKANTDRIIRAGDEVSVGATNDQFGDAMPGDVRKGKTFTSAAGLLKMGELEVQSFTVTDDGAGNVTITSSAITDNNGNVVIE
jgi:hypothetical protein